VDLRVEHLQAEDTRSGSGDDGHHFREILGGSVTFAQSGIGKMPDLLLELADAPDFTLDARFEPGPQNSMIGDGSRSRLLTKVGV
jgi:hypothetical protein